MLSRKSERSNAYTYFYGGLTEEEQMYRDYFETDLEEHPDDEAAHERFDKIVLGQNPDFNLDRFDF